MSKRSNSSAPVFTANETQDVESELNDLIYSETTSLQDSTLGLTISDVDSVEIIDETKLDLVDKEPENLSEGLEQNIG